MRYRLAGIGAPLALIVGAPLMAQAPDHTAEEAARLTDLETVMQATEAMTAAYGNRDWAEVDALASRIEEVMADPRYAATLSPREQRDLAALIALFRADAARETGRFAEALPLYDTALAAFRDTPGVEKHYLATLGKRASMLRAMGDNAAAMPVFEEIERRGREEFGEDSVQYATAVSNVAESAHIAGDYARARAEFARSLALYRAMEPDGDVALLTGLAQGHLAKTDRALGDLDAARKGYDAALATLEPLGDAGQEYRAIVHSGRAALAMQMGDRAGAEDAGRRSLAAWNGAKGADHPATLQAIDSLAAILLNTNRADEAEPLSRRALDGLVARFGTDHELSASAASTMGAIQGALGRREAAERYLRQARDGAVAALGTDHPGVAYYHNNLATTLFNQKRYEDAKVEQERALAALEEAGMADHYSAISSWVNLGSIALLTAEREAALTAYRRARAIVGRLQSPASPVALPAINGLAFTLATADPADEEAFALSRSAVDIIRQLRRTGRPPGGGARALVEGPVAAPVARDAGRLREAGDTFQFHLKLLADRARALPDEQAALGREALSIVQEMNVSASAKAMAQTRARTAAGTGELAALARRQQEAERALVQADAAYQAALVEGGTQDGADRITTARARLDALGRSLEEANAALAARFPDYARLVAPDPLTAEEIAARLDPDEAVLIVMPAIGGLVSMVVADDGITWFRSHETLDGIAADVARLRCQVDVATCAEKNGLGQATPAAPTPSELEGYRAYDRAAAYRLYENTVKPVEEALTGKRHVFVVATRSLAAMPFAAMVTAPPAAGEDAADPDALARAAWLGDRYAFTTLPAVASLRQPKGERGARREADWSFLGVGAPELAGDPSDARGATRAGANGFFRAGGGGAEDVALADPDAVRRLAPLPGSMAELTALAETLNAAPGSVLTGKAATEQAVRAAPALADSTVVTFATHGLLPGDLNGLDEPALVFTPPATASLDDDGVLTASEAAALDMRARWVILSACNTASAGTGSGVGNGGGSGGGGDSLSGLSRAFLYAGADALLASHWRVGDAETAALTVETIRADRSRSNAGRAAALQGAMKLVRTGKRPDGTALAGWRPDWAHPASWAAFVHISGSD